MRNQSFYKNISFWQESDDGIIFWKYSPQIEIDIVIAKELVTDRLDYTNGKSVYALVDVTNIKSTTKEARDYLNAVEGGLQGLSAGAFLSNNVVSTLVINLFLKISSPAIPAKFFTDKNEALTWLKSVRTEKGKLTLQQA
jgi:hypothetical protein